MNKKTRDPRIVQSFKKGYCVLVRVEIIHKSKFLPGTVEKYSSTIRSSGRNRTHACAMPVHCSDHQATEVADKSERNYVSTMANKEKTVGIMVCLLVIEESLYGLRLLKFYKVLSGKL